MKTLSMTFGAAFIFMASIALVGCKNARTTTATTGEDSLQTTDAQVDQEPKINYNGKTVYVQIDSLMRGYGKAIDLQDAFTKKNEKVERDLTAQGRALQREARDFQDKYNKGQMTAYQANEAGTALQKKEQNYNAYAERVTGELMQEREVMMNQISEAIMAYIKKYNVEKGYSMILGTTGAATVLTADPAMDITTELLEGLNAEYKQELAAAQKGK